VEGVFAHRRRGVFWPRAPQLIACADIRQPCSGFGSRLRTDAGMRRMASRAASSSGWIIAENPPRAGRRPPVRVKTRSRPHPVVSSAEMPNPSRYARRASTREAGYIVETGDGCRRAGPEKMHISIAMIAQMIVRGIIRRACAEDDKMYETAALNTDGWQTWRITAYQCFRLEFARERDDQHVRISSSNSFSSIAVYRRGGKLPWS
jgi:hypothetical protein